MYPYPFIEREFDRMIKKATPYLILAPESVRDNVAGYMKAAYRAMRNNNDFDFDLNCTKVSEVIANSKDCIGSNLECDIADLDTRWAGLDESISRLRKELIDIRTEITDLRKGLNLLPEVIPVIEQNELPKKRLTPSEREQKLDMLRNYLKTNREIDNPKARVICEVNRNRATYLLQKLVEEKFVEPKGKARATKYVLI